MADLPNRGATPEHISPEDPATAATRKELKHTAISDDKKTPNMSTTSQISDPAGEKEIEGEQAPAHAGTPDSGTSDEKDDRLKEMVSSPKKKRAHDQVEEQKEEEVAEVVDGDASPKSANGSAAVNRTNRSEPEKKRHRDISSESKQGTESGKHSEDATVEKDTASAADTAKTTAGEKLSAEPAGDKKPATTSSSAFASSGIASFSSSASPFLSSGTTASKPLTSFASPSGNLSPFGAAASAKTETQSSIFGSSSTTNGSSPFGQVGGAKPFGGGSVFGGGFGAPTSGAPLTSFGTAGGSFGSGKPAKAFGAPESDNEDDDDENDEEGEGQEELKEDKEADEERATPAEDKKKLKLQQIEVDTGETGEATILQVRAKIFHLDKASQGWKERGAGNLKINVPESCIEFDEHGVPISGSFDASALEDAESKIIRLIMRQDSTHRVILNTAIIPAMKFQEKPTLKATCVLFTAIEGEGEAVSIQLKMSAVNAKSFLNEVGSIQRELQTV